MGSQIGNTTDLLNAIQTETPLFNINKFSYAINRPRQEIVHLKNKLKYVYFKDPRHLLNIQIAWQQNKRKEFDLAIISQKPELDLTLTTTQADVWYEHKHNYWMHTYGTAATLQDNYWQGNRFFIPNFRSFNAAVYHISEYNKNNINAEFGIRFDNKTLHTYRNNNNNIYTTNNNWNNLSATANINFKRRNNFTYGFNSAIAKRPPSINELFVNGLHHGTSSFEVGNPNLNSETAFKIAFKTNKYFADSLFKFDVYIYNNFIKGFINLVADTPPTLTIRGAFPTFKYVQTNANLAGYDVNFVVNPTNFLQYQINYSSIFAYNLLDNTWLQQLPGNRILQQLSYKVLGKKHNCNLTFNLKHKTVFNQNRLAANYTDYLPPPETYTIFNGYISFHYKNSQLLLGANNIFNTIYREYLNRFRYFNNETGRNLYIKYLVTI